MTTEKYKGIYRIPSARWRDWDYGSNAFYFVTICTAHREQYFGKIADGELTMSEIGQIAHDCWIQIPAHFPFVLLGAFVIMPNHVHGVIVIDKRDDDLPAAGIDADANIVETQDFASLQRTQLRQTQLRQTQNLASLRQQKTWQSNKFGPQSKNLASIIRGFKIGVTLYANQHTIPFAWQTRFHDRIIRNYDELTRVERYIDTNINNWCDDEFYTI